MLDQELKSKINLLWDKFWSNGVSNPLQAIEQISYLLFLKKLEDEDSKRIENASKNNLKYSSIFTEDKYKWSVWSNFSADKIIPHIRDEVFPFLRNLAGTDTVYQKYMKNAVFSIPSASLLIEATNIINSLDIKEQNTDTKGDLYEYLLSELSTAGKNGQFRTPRHIIKMMVELTNPQSHESICDPACGTAGFLVSAYEHIIDSKKLNSTKKEMLHDSLHGFEIDQTMTRISLMNLMMHGINNPKITRLNTLSRLFDQRPYYDVILANPPFKGSVDESEISEELVIKTKKTELLFLELMYNILSDGGRCAVIIPDGVLFGGSKSHQQVKQLIVDNANLQAIISMPSGVFKPYAGVSTAILFFTKKGKTKNVWFYDMENDGFSLDDKRKPITQNDIPDIITNFNKLGKEKFEDRKAKCFFVPVKEIRENNYDLSISKYKEMDYEETVFDKPDVIKKNILERENKIISVINELENFS
ncbi:N-6 DNA methylase [Candidatus Woesearchaeota archaeon]|jgi:type I restriction enzyme M protein|nr:N-6 DNA methylase [Candidatus Woesearchaeota archaeon]MBT6336088.1 N-6 DNA methylase [Candidatus Woesearchaeota archaeon]MBT7927323.1 N-6 DNA methylase [Candidatus Woesearchaeota archaeon]